MRKRPFHQRDDELNYWQSISDVMTALLLIILLVMMLFILYMTRVPDFEDLPGDNVASFEESGSGDDWDWADHYHSLYDDDGRDGDSDHDEDGADGANGDDGDGEDSGDFAFEFPGEGDYPGDERAAVYVTVRDGETGRPIKEQGISFKLYDGSNRLQVLSTYYPVNRKYESFETTEQGNFYLPEKVKLGSYYLHEISVPYGYDFAEDVSFLLEEAFEWDEPYALSIELYPCRNVIRIQSVDGTSGEALVGAVYEVVAEEDIITADGTLRCTAGEVADTITCGAGGIGESKELFLGPYRLRQVVPVLYYAAPKEDTIVYLERREMTTAQDLQTIALEKTKVTLTLTDELYEERAVSGAGFILSGSDGSVREELMTGAGGRIILEDLRPGVTYSLTQTEFPKGYLERTDSMQPLTFTVSEMGRIEDEAAISLQATNRMIRIRVRVCGFLFGNEISDRGLSLIDASGGLIDLWSSSGSDQEMEGMKPGVYTLVLDGRYEKEIEILNTKEVQSFVWRSWSVVDVLALLAVGLLLILFFTLLIHRIQTRRAKKTGKKSEKKGGDR